MFRTTYTRRNWLKSVSGICAVGLTADCIAQEATPANAEATPEPMIGPQIGEWKTNRWRFGLTVSSATAMLEGVHATFTLPRDWPEQKIRVVDKNFAPYVVGTEVRNLLDLAAQVVLKMSRVPPGAIAEVVVTCEVEKATLLPPDPIGVWKVPERPDRDKVLRIFLTSSPYIDPRHSKIRRAATEIAAEGTDDGWKFVEQIYDWVREKVRYREGDIKTAVQALDDGEGDCEELTSLFVAICRASHIPARMVWVPGHAYPEFYLENDAGKGAWFPCQIAGTREFGGMTEDRPIMQKGDRFKVPEHHDIQRYVAEFCKIDAVRGTGKPKVSFISEKVFE